MHVPSTVPTPLASPCIWHPHQNRISRSLHTKIASQQPTLLCRPNMVAGLRHLVNAHEYSSCLHAVRKFSWVMCVIHQDTAV